jgi:branched-chain amino acid transport system substrate-binding protein
MNRRHFLRTAGSAGAVVLVSGNLRAALAATTGPIRIGFLAPLTGTAASAGRELVDGWNLYWKLNGQEIAGRKIEVIVEDDASSPDTALQKARRLVQQQKVHMLVGDVLANTGLAVAEYVKTTGTPYFMPVVAADDLTQRTRIPNVLRVAGFAASQMTRPLADWCLKQGYKRVVTIGQDYSFGHEQAGGFIQNFTQGGGKLVGQLWHPLNTADFSPYLGQIPSFNPDVVLAIETGADAARLLKQWSNFALKDQYPLVTSQNTTDQSIIRNLQPAEALGIVSSAHYAEGADNPAVQKFVDAYEKAYKMLPAIFAAEGYTAGLWIADAIKQVKGDVEQTDQFLSAIKKINIPESPLGKDLHMDEYGNPIYNIYIRKVVQRKDGKLVNAVIDSYPNVSQFGKLSPEAYLKQPPFSRDFQGVAK